MNTVQKKSLGKIARALTELKDSLELEAKALQDAWDEKSERWQESDAGQEAADEISEIEDVASNLEEEVSRLNELTGNELVG